MELLILVAFVGLLLTIIHKAASEQNKPECKPHKWEYKEQGMTCIKCGFVPKFEGRDD